MRSYEDNHKLNQTLKQPVGRTRAKADQGFTPEPLQVGTKVKFYGDRRWWTVRCFNSTHAVLTRTGDFGRPMVYTVIAWKEGRRGPHGSWGHAAITDQDCLETLDAISTGLIDMSERHSIYLDFKEAK